VPTAEDVQAVLETPPAPTVAAPRKPGRPNAEVTRARARELIDALPARHLETICAFLTFLVERKGGNSLHESALDVALTGEQPEGDA
jgi:hypothetical protein